eukprot:s386_g9.t1
MARSLGQWGALKITTAWVLLGLSLVFVGLLTGLLGIVMKNTANSPLQIGALLMVCFGCITTFAALAETFPACCRDEGRESGTSADESGTSADESGTSAPEARRLRWATCTFRNLTAEVAEFHEVVLRGHEDQKRLEGSTLVLPPTKVWVVARRMLYIVSVVVFLDCAMPFAVRLVAFGAALALAKRLERTGPELELDEHSTGKTTCQYVPELGRPSNLEQAQVPKLQEISPRPDALKSSRSTEALTTWRSAASRASRASRASTSNSAKGVEAKMMNLIQKCLDKKVLEIQEVKVQAPASEVSLNARSSETVLTQMTQPEAPSHVETDTSVKADPQPEADDVFADWEEGDEGEEVADESGEYAIVSSCPGLESHVAVFEDIGRRRAMEDRHSVRNVSGACDGGQAGYLGLFDGHGGEWTAGWLARALHRRLRAQLRPGRPLKSAIEAAFVSFDKDQLLRRSSNVLEPGTGSTALVALLCNCSLHLANLGDCRAVGALRDAWPDSSSSGAAADEDAPWPKGAIVEVADSRIPDLRGQRGNVVEARAAGSSKNHRVVYVVRLKRDGALRPFKSQALRLLSVLRAVRLTKDHKPASPEERQRIEAMGGQIDVLSAKTGEESSTEVPRSARVAGLATSRSFTGSERRPLVSADPEQWVVPLTPPRGATDEDNASECANKAPEVPDPSAFSAAASPVFIVLASDGVWDVLEDQLVVDLVWDFLGSVQDPQRGIVSALREAAELVVQAAKDRGSTDNLTCAILLLSWEEKMLLKASPPAALYV